MRDANGLFIGASSCVNWKGVREVATKVCCGGRKTPIALADCVKLGVVEAEVVCNASCPHRVDKP